MLLLWLRSLARTAAGRTLATAGGIALATGLAAILVLFVTGAGATMTARAVATVPVDWQVELAPGADAAPIAEALAGLRPGAIALVDYANVPAFSARTDNTEQVTGAGRVVGLPADYRTDFPGQFTLLAGTWDGLVLYAQTAANLHAAVGDSVRIDRGAAGSAEAVVTGVAAIPNIDSLFQAIGVPSGFAPQSPPDNIALLPDADWHALFDAARGADPALARSQFHVRLDRGVLPAAPVPAYALVVGLGHNLEARIAGSGVLANNLAARLDAVRSDALYATLIFLFLGAPGVIAAGLLARALAASGRERRRREQALLRLRGATIGQALLPALVETLAVAIVGIAAGGILAALASATLVGAVTGAGVLLAVLIAGMGGLILAAGVMLAPAIRDFGAETVTGTRAESTPDAVPLWQRLWLDLILVALAVIVFARTQGAGYQIVLATEGVAQTSVSYEAVLGPLALWIGLGLLALRIGDRFLAGRSFAARAIAPLAAGLGDTVAASFARQRRRIARTTALLGIAVAFAVSTASFNVTYGRQAEVDAQLTNGADVAVTGTTASPAGPSLAAVAAHPGVAAAEPMMHRYAYVGADLQDLYGIDPVTIRNATSLANAYFGNLDAGATLDALARTPNGVLVSEETVLDFQLQLGDAINLRLQSASDNSYHVVPFVFVGTVREFPSAPKDSFLVANAAYIAEATGQPASEMILVRTTDPTGVATRLRAALAGQPALVVTAMGETRSLISSSLTSVSVRGLTAIELGFGIVLIAAAAGLGLGLGFAERQRTFAIIGALGATPRQLGAFIRSEGLLVAIGGLVFGIATGLLTAGLLVKVLAGVFDPPPETMALPWSYVGLVVASVAAAVAIVVLAFERLHRRPDAARLKA